MTPAWSSRATAAACTALLLAGAAVPPAWGQSLPTGSIVTSTDARGGPTERARLEAARRLVAAVALCPDPILSAVLEAATTPLDVVEAERFLAKRAQDPTLAPESNWSPAILALLNHPDLLRRMSEDLDWTRTLGAAVVDDLPVIQQAIQEIRQGALAAGLLADTEFQRIVREEDLIAIEPTDPESVRLPVYDADQLLAALALRGTVGEAAEVATREPAAEPAPPASGPEPPRGAAEPAPAPAAASLASSPVSPSAAPAPSYAPPATAEPSAAAPAPAVTYGAPERGFWSDAAIFAGGAALGGVLGYLLADRDDDQKVVKKYYYFGDRRPPGWRRERIDWRDDGWRPGARIVRADKIVIKDSNVVVNADDIVVRRLGERRGELLRVARSGDLPPERWHDWERAERRPRDGKGVQLLEARLVPVAEPARIAVLPDRRGEAQAQRMLERQERRRAREQNELQRQIERRHLLEAKRQEEERRRLERERAREAKAAAERSAHEQRRRAQAQVEQRRAAEKQRLERARMAELARGRELERRKVEEQAELSRRQQREARREERRFERQQRRGDPRHQQGVPKKKKGLGQD